MGTSVCRWQLRRVWTSEGLPVLGSMSVDCGGQALALIKGAGIFALIIASAAIGQEVSALGVLRVG